MLNIHIGLFIGYYIGTKIHKYFGTFGTLYHGPDSNKIKQKVFYCDQKKKYYKFIPKPYICPPMYSKCLKQ